MSSPLPAAKVIHVETRGAVILDEASPDVRMLFIHLPIALPIDDMARLGTVEVFICPTT
jgi:hypothetical protein